MERIVTFDGPFARLRVRVGKDGDALVVAEADSVEAMGQVLKAAALQLGIPLLAAPDEGSENGDDPVLFLAAPAAT